MHDQNNKCENIVRQLLKVQAQVKVTPFVKHGEPNVYCIDSQIKPKRKCHDYEYEGDSHWESDCLRNKCNFTLTQLICVEIPICVDADIDIKEGIVCCGKPEVDVRGCK